jgi:hypothetical protein
MQAKVLDPTRSELPLFKAHQTTSCSNPHPTAFANRERKDIIAGQTVVGRIANEPAILSPVQTSCFTHPKPTF